jgi:diguanylate cyclase (GGDEF)-like protein
MRQYTEPAAAPQLRRLPSVSETAGQIAPYDELTELPNRRAFHDHVQAAIGVLRRHPHDRFAVVLVDLDSFKALADKFGQSIADKLLAATARRLELCVGPADIVARVEAGSFAILLNEIATVADAERAAERVATLMDQPAFIDERNVRVTVTIGLAIGKPEHRRPQEILRDAGAAMHAARDAARGSAVRVGRLPHESQTARLRSQNPRAGHGIPIDTAWSARARGADDATLSRPNAVLGARPVAESTRSKAFAAER